MSEVQRDLHRILSVPQITDHAAPQWIYDLVTRPGAPMQLRPVQAEMLAKAVHARGLFANVQVGHGKTLPGLLMPTVLNAPRAVYMLPAKLKQTCCSELERYVPSFDFRHVPHLMTYAELSGQRNYNPNLVWSEAEGKYTPDPDNHYTLLDLLEPDLIILDEAHRLANRNSARTKRFLRYVKRRRPMLVVMTGSVIEKGLEDFAHLIAYALGEASPLPKSFVILQAWSRCIDAGDAHYRAQPGDWREVAPLVEAFGGGSRLTGDPDEDRQTVREAFHRRLKSCPGVVLTDTQSVDVPLYIDRVDSLPIPAEVQLALAKVESSWTLPNGEEILSSLALVAALREIALGFYYFWNWQAVSPDGAPDQEWLDTRSAYRRLARQVIKRSKPGLDTEGLVRNAILEGRETDPELVEAFRAWEHNRVRLRNLMDARGVDGRTIPDNPPTLAGWISDYVLHDVCQAIGEWGAPTLVWCGHNEVLGRFQGSGILPVYDHPIPRDLHSTPHLALSVDKFGEGQNLQEWAHNIFLATPAQGKAWEQWIGRTHRAGQTQAVRSRVYAHTPHLASALDQAKDERSTFNATLTGAAPKLLDAQWRSVVVRPSGSTMTAQG